jgi:hypothetical protein
MSWFGAILPAIMTVGKGAMAAGQAVAHGAEAAGQGVAHGAESAGSEIGKGAEAVGSKMGIGGGGGGGAAAGTGTPSAAMPAAGSASTKAPSMMDKMDSFMDRPSVKMAQNMGGNIFKGAGQSSPVPNEQSGAPVENPIAPSPSFPGGDSAMPQALMPGAMDEPFGAPGRRALSDTLSRNGG